MATYPASQAGRGPLGARQATGPDGPGAGLRLNAVAPGMIDTPMVAGMRADAETGPLLDMLPIPVGRPGRPEEIAALIEFLLGPDAAFFCGSVLFCDGGSDALLRTRDWPAAWDIAPASSAGDSPDRQPAGRPRMVRRRVPGDAGDATARTRRSPAVPVRPS